MHLNSGHDLSLESPPTHRTWHFLPSDAIQGVKIKILVAL